MLEKLKLATKETLIDPGVGFGLVNVCFFFGGNPVGVVACAGAAGLIAIGKILQAVNPPFMQKNIGLTRIIKDNKTPLRLLGLALLTVLGATLVQNATDLWTISSSVSEFISKGWITTILPAVASAAFATADFRLAATTSAGPETKTESAVMTPKRIMKLIALRPETYISIGSLAIGLVSGGAALLAAPLIMTGFAMTLKNVLQNRPAYTGHPNAHFAGMTGILSAVAFAVGNPLIGLGYLLNSAYLVRIESMTTPGGFRQVMEDMKKGLQSLPEMVRGKKVAAPVPGIDPVPEHIAPSPLLPATKDLGQNFNLFAEQKQPSSPDSKADFSLKIMNNK